MSRIRSVKPDFWSSEQVMSVPRDARLLFIGVWNFADDTGRFRWSPQSIKAQVLPGDFDVTEQMIEEWLSCLVQGGLLVHYRNGGKSYGWVTGWKHQKISHPQPAKYPDPQGKGSTIQPFRFDSVNGPGTDPVHSALIRSELIGSELKGVESSARASAPLSLLRVAADLESENGQSPRTVSSSETQAFDDTFRSEAFRRDIVPTPSLTRSQRTTAIQRTNEYAAAKRLTFADAAEQMVSQAFDDSAATGTEVCFSLGACQPGRPAEPRFKPHREAPERQVSDFTRDAIERSAGKFY